MKVIKYKIKANILYKDRITKIDNFRNYYFRPLRVGSYEFICESTFKLNAKICDLKTGRIINSAYQKNKKFLKLASTLLANETYIIKIYVNELQEKDKIVEYIFKLNTIELPLCSHFKYQWGLFNSETGIDINILPAWKYVYNTNLKIGIVDNGIKYNHPNLKENINLKLCYDFLSDNNNCYSNSEEKNLGKGHGTFIAGIITSQIKNKIGIVGISNNKNIISLKIFGTNEEKKIGFKTTSNNFVSAIEYAMKNDIKILNCSFSGKNINLKERNLIKKAKNILFIVSAGNSSLNLDKKKIYPTCYELENIIVVGAINKKGELYPTSNYGNVVDIAAPGENIISTYVNDGYIKASGTSVAVPFVTGVCSLLLTKYPKLSANEIKKIITNSDNITKSEKLIGKVKTGGIINAYKALFSL